MLAIATPPGSSTTLPVPVKPSHGREDADCSRNLRHIRDDPPVGHEVRARSPTVSVGEPHTGATSTIITWATVIGVAIAHDHAWLLWSANTLICQATLVDVEAMIDQIATCTTVSLGPHQIREYYLLVAEFAKGEEEIALTLPAGIIHDHNVAVSVLADPGVGYEAVGASVARPRRQWLELGPSAVSKGARVLQHR